MAPWWLSSQKHVPDTWPAGAAHILVLPDSLHLLSLLYLQPHVTVSVLWDYLPSRGTLQTLLSPLSIICRCPTAIRAHRFFFFKSEKIIQRVIENLAMTRERKRLRRAQVCSWLWLYLAQVITLSPVKKKHSLRMLKWKSFQESD